MLCPRNVRPYSVCTLMDGGDVDVRDGVGERVEYISTFSVKVLLVECVDLL